MVWTPESGQHSIESENKTKNQNWISKKKSATFSCHKVINLAIFIGIVLHTYFELFFVIFLFFFAKIKHSQYYDCIRKDSTFFMRRPIRNIKINNKWKWKWNVLKVILLWLQKAYQTNWFEINFKMKFTKKFIQSQLERFFSLWKTFFFTLINIICFPQQLFNFVWQYIHTHIYICSFSFIIFIISFSSLDISLC